MQLKLEHIALNVSNPVEMAAWYETHLGLKTVRKTESNHTHFLADKSGTILIEIYNNPPDEVPAYDRMDPLQLHLGFVSEDPVRDRDTLVKAGASIVGEVVLPDRSHLVMLRDPWGLSIQLCKRTNTMV